MGHSSLGQCDWMTSRQCKSWGSTGLRCILYNPERIQRALSASPVGAPCKCKPGSGTQSGCVMDDRGNTSDSAHATGLQLAAVLTPTRQDAGSQAGDVATVGHAKDGRSRGSSLVEVELESSETRSPPPPPLALAEARGSALSGASFNFINSIIGAGIIGLPFAIRESGFVMGLFLLFLSAVLTDYTVRLLVRTGAAAKVHNYEDLCERALGPRGFYAVSILMFLFAYGAMVAYFIVIGDTMPQVFESWVGGGILTNRQFHVAVFGICFILPLSLLKNMSSLAWSSGLSLAAVFVLVFTVAARAPVAAHDQGVEVRSDSFSFIQPRIFAGLGAISFAFVCHHSSFIVFSSLSKPTVRRWKLVTHISVGTAIIACTILAVSAYCSFLHTTKGDVLNNFGPNDQAINVARLLLSSTMVFTYPMEHFVARHCAHAVMYKGTEMSNRQRYVITSVLFGSSLLLGLTLEDLGPVLELTGAASASCLAYILPILCHFALMDGGFRHNWKEAIAVWKPSSPQHLNTFQERWAASSVVFLPAAIFVLGITAAIVGTITVFV